LGKALRIPCYRGWGPVRLTYGGFERQIRGVLQVAKFEMESTGAAQLLTQTASKYRYSDVAASSKVNA
jgi:hypothetical protein